MNKVLKIIENEQESIAKEIDRRKEFKDNLDILSGGIIYFNFLSEIEILKGQINILEAIKDKSALNVKGVKE